MRFLSVLLVSIFVGACSGDDTGSPDSGLPDTGTPDSGTPDSGTPDAGDPSVPPACEPPDAFPTTCNGDVSLCAKRFDEVAYPTTHNAFSTTDDFLAANQTHRIPRQLEDGVRGLMLDIYEMNGEILLCHGGCGRVLGQTPLVDTLIEIREFLRCHPGEVISIIFESYVSAELVEDAFVASGAIDYVRAQPLDAAWPTLTEMIAADERLVVFTDKEGGAFDWYLDVWAYARETPYAAETPDDLSCTGGRGPLDGGLLIFNNFLTNALGSPELADMVNHDPFLIDRIDQCEEELGQFANFITVDYYEIGDLFEAVSTSNGLTP
jgi:hypothetical protein